MCKASVDILPGAADQQAGVTALFGIAWRDRYGAGTAEAAARSEGGREIGVPLRDALLAIEGVHAAIAS